MAALVFALYAATIRPDVGGTEDSPKFQLVGHVLGTAHSPGYPLYVVLTYLFTRVPIGVLALRVNLFSALCGALACACAFLIARRLRVSGPIAAAAALAAATSAGVWRNAVIAEVYTLGALLAASTVVLLLAWGHEGGRRRLYAACAVFAAGLGNHLTIVGVLPAALAYGIARDRTVVRPRVIATAFAIGVAGVLQYGFIALRTVQRAAYTEARANSVRGVLDVMMARDQSWARFQYGASDLVAIQLPHLLSALRNELGLAALVLAAVAIGAAVGRRHADVLLVAGAAAGMLALVLNLSGDIGGFITPVVVLLWPLAAAGLQTIVGAIAVPRAVIAVSLAALAVPVLQAATNRHAVAPLRDTDDVRGLRAMYGRLPANAVVIADNYWIARVLDYLHLSNEYDPDPNPTIIAREIDRVREAVGQGRPVFAFEGSLPWLASHGMGAARTDFSHLPLAPWLQRQPRGTRVIMAAAGRPLPLEWLPAANRAQGTRPPMHGAVLWTMGDGAASIDQGDTSAAITAPIGTARRVMTIVSNGDGPIVTWGDDVLSAIDRGLTVVVVSPRDEVVGRWSFDVEAPLQMPLAPAVYALDGSRAANAEPLLPPTGQIDVGVAGNVLFGEGWYVVERGGTQRFRWSKRVSELRLPLANPADLRLLLRVRAAHRDGATLQASMNRTPVGSCALPAGIWTDCRLTVPAALTRGGMNALTLEASTTMAPEDRRSDPRELAFAMQESRIRTRAP